MNTAKQLLAIGNRSEQSRQLFKLAVEVEKDFNDQDMTFHFQDGSKIRLEDGEMREIVESRFGAVNFKGVEYILAQNAHVSDNGEQYQALAVDADGDEFMVVWDVVINEEDRGDLTDESIMCDWDQPAAVQAL